METLDLSALPLFSGLTAEALAGIAAEMRQRHFGPGEYLCRQGEPGDSLFAIRRGLARVIVEPPDGSAAAVVARLRRGDVVGELSLVTGEPRSASVLASVATDAFELGQEAFARVLARHPVIFSNLSRILSQRLVRTNVQQFERRNRGEAVALIVGVGAEAIGHAAVEAAKAASPREVIALELAQQANGIDGQDEPQTDRWLSLLGQLPSPQTTVIAVAGTDQRDLPILVEHADRAVIVAEEREVRSLASTLAPLSGSVEVVLLTDQPRLAPRSIEGVPVVRGLDAGRPTEGVAWLGRHLSRTKLGLALGAGGAKGFAHIGAIQVLAEAGYTVDYVAGSSIGALVGAWLALGLEPAEIERTMRDAFTPEAVAATFTLGFSGTSTGLEGMIRLCQETTRERAFADLLIPLVVMAVDLNTWLPAPISEGPVWDALLAATALVGLFPPRQRDGQRLVDGLHLVPVPAGAVIEAGADITVSVNLLSRETLTAWPGESPPEPAPKAGARMLDTLLEVMDLSQLDASVRTAALADVVITPRFGPASWRDFQLADRFLTAGRAAAELQLPSLRTLARPQIRMNHSAENTNRGELYGTAAVHV